MPCRIHLFFHICAFHQIERESKWKSKLAFIIHKRLELATTMKMSCRKDSDNNNDSNKSSNHKRRQRFLWASRTMLCDFVRSFHGISKKLALLPHLPAALSPVPPSSTSFSLQSAHCLSVCLPVWLNIYAAKLRRLMLTGQKLLLKIISIWSENCKIFTKSCTAHLSPFNWQIDLIMQQLPRDRKE